MLPGLEVEVVDAVAQRRERLLKNPKNPNNRAEPNKSQRMNKQFKMKLTNIFFYENDFLWDR